MSRMLDVLLGGLAALLITAIALQLAPVDQAKPVIAAVRRHRPTGAALPDQTNGWVATIVSRPLFSPTRRPQDMAQAADGKQGPAVLPRLAGILIGPGGSRAIFAPEGSKPIVVSAGATVSGTTINAITQGAVVITGPDGRQVLRPAFDHATKSQPTPAPFRLPGGDVLDGQARLPGLLPGLLAAPEGSPDQFPPIQPPAGTQP